MWILLLVPFVGLLWVPFYNSLEPALFGFPFFYWYQLAWVPLSSLLIWVVYWLCRAGPLNCQPIASFLKFQPCGLMCRRS